MVKGAKVRPMEKSSGMTMRLMNLDFLPHLLLTRIDSA
jgi:hypothetical protein